MMNLKDAHRPDTVPDPDRYTNIWNADNRKLIEAPGLAQDYLGQKPPKLWEQSKQSATRV